MMRAMLLTAFAFLFVGSANSLRRSPRQSGRNARCRYRGIDYTIGQELTFRIRTKQFDCTCVSGGRLDCSWSYITPPENARCADRVTGDLKDVGEKWERIRDGKIFDCVCSRGFGGMQVECSDENRCHHDGSSYVRGSVFTTNSISGRTMTCTCLVKKELSCRYEETLQVPHTDAQWVDKYIVYGGKILRPQITTLQACRTGAKVVTSGIAWNQTTTNPLGVRVIERCACIDAIVKCKTVRVLDQIEPHCLSSDGRHRTIGQKWLRVREHFPDQQFECVCQSHENINCRRVRRPRCVDDVDGTIRVAGEKWVREHETLSNLKFECTCQTNTKVACQDIGECVEPPAPVNGALMCAKVGRPGPKQVTYCKPMCLADYEYSNPQRYYRIWEVCGAMNLHRWSGGFVGDPLAIARCTGMEQGDRSYTKRGHPNLYLPTNDCKAMTHDQIEGEKSLFLRQLHYRSVCQDTCEITVFKCGAKL